METITKIFFCIYLLQKQMWKRLYDFSKKNKNYSKYFYCHSRLQEEDTIMIREYDPQGSSITDGSQQTQLQ